ncbi:YesL family protein [Domibacillus indicus]|uniref:YesL family protein n=1 Tax=Domibacillus indicus TaxID=1437523 RepID=UPI000618141C|nr:DUF624 domain-containing protein [Domibacillus indicus]
MKRTFVFTEWLAEVLGLHFLWVLYVLKGWILMGIFPATAAVYAVVQHWMKKEEPISLSDLYKKRYYENYRAANILGWMFLAATCILLVNIYYLPYYPETLRLVMYPVLLFFTFILLISWLYLFPAVVRFNIPAANYFAVILKIGFTSFTGIIIQLFFLGIYLTVIYMLPALLLLFGLVPFVFLQMAVMFNIFQKLN